MPIKLCNAHANPISIYQSLPVGRLRIAQNPTISMPSMSIATALSGAVGPLNIRYRQRKAHKRRKRRERARKCDCQLNIEGTGQKSMTAASTEKIKTPEQKKPEKYAACTERDTFCRRLQTSVHIRKSYEPDTAEEIEYQPDNNQY